MKVWKNHQKNTLILGVSWEINSPTFEDEYYKDGENAQIWKIYVNFSLNCDRKGGQCS